MNDVPVIVDEATTGELADFRHAVHDTDRDIREGVLDGRRRFAAMRLTIGAVDTLNQDRLRRRGAAVGRENDVDRVRIDRAHTPSVSCVDEVLVSRSNSASKCSTRRRMCSIEPRCSVEGGLFVGSHDEHGCVLIGQLNQ